MSMTTMMAPISILVQGPRIGQHDADYQKLSLYHLQF
jgi:hypothetical protein